MVTATRIGGNNELATFSFTGKSSDTKPTGEWEGTTIKNGSSFFEMDTQDVVFYDGDSENWLPKQ